MEKRLNKIRKNAGLYVIFIPVLIYFIIFCYVPMYGVQIAFKNFIPKLGITGSPFIGFDHFMRFFNGFFFWRLIRNTIGISVYNLLVSIPAPVILALMFNEIRNKRIRTVFQTISYAPHFLSVVVVVSLIMFFLSPTNGVINNILAAIGKERINFLTEPGMFWNIYVWSGSWQSVGWGTIIYTATISGIPVEQYEAAVIDGASKWQRIIHITLPGIIPTIIIISIMNAGHIMSVGFEKIFLLQNGLNQEMSEVISTYVYKNGIENTQFSFSAAVGLFNNVINFIVLIIVNTIAGKISETSLW